jgi:glucose/arabinose dehydrogenase
MNTFPYVIFMVTFAVIISCGPKINQPETKGGNTNSGTDPVETEAANTTYPPAFTGQTRIAGIRTLAPYKADVLDSSLDKPWGIAALPDGRFLITEKKGNMRIASATGAVGEPITGLPEVNNGGQGGLLGLCIDPAFNQNRMVY